MTAAAGAQPPEPTDALGFAERGADRLEAGQYEGALADLTEAIRRDPELVAAYGFRGQVFLKQGALDNAIADLSAALRLNPAATQFWSYRGGLFLERGRIDEAIADCTEALRLAPQDALAHHVRGRCYGQAGQSEKARADFDAAIRLDPQFVEPFLYRGELLWYEGDLDAALADFTSAVQLNPQHARAHRWRGSILRRQGLLDEAIASFTEAIRLSPQNALAYLNRGSARAHARDDDGALADYTEAIRLDPPNALPYYYRGRAYQDLDDRAAALADFNAALQRDPRYLDALLSRGELLHADQEFDAALTDYSEAIRLDPHRAEAYWRRGVLHHDRGELPKAVADLTEAIRLNPDDEFAYRSRCRVWDDLGEPVKADTDFEAFEAARARRRHSHEETMPAHQMQIFTLLKDHFEPTTLDDLVVTERRFPYRVLADLHRGMDDFLATLTVRHFSGVRQQRCGEELHFTELLVRNRELPAVCVPPQYEEIDIGEAEPVRCLKTGLWLLEENGSRFAVFLEPAPQYSRYSGIRFQVAVGNGAAGAGIVQRFFKHLEKAVADARSYRGKVLSLEWTDNYSGASSGIRVHRLRRVEREQVILPRKTLELLERNVIEFVRQRPRLAGWGLATKKGLLFYGPPGTGKTHTVHYLAGALPGMTTLLITAEQVGLLGEYMTLARLLQPSMVVIEDADLIGRERTDMSVCEEVMLNKLLNEMDGLREEADILFVLTTNRPEALETALTSRPGRIDQAIEFPFPDEEGRAKLVQLYARGVPLTEEVVRMTVRKTGNVSAAFIKELMRRAAQFQLERQDADGITLQNVDDALEELLFSGGSLNRKLLGVGVE